MKINLAGTKNKKTRELWLERVLKEVLAGKKILDAGAGELQYKKYCNHLDYVSQDFGQYDGVGNEEGLQTNKWDNSKLDIVSDITKIPVDDNSFDAVMCVEVLEHIVEPAKAVKEFSRILKKGGKLVLTAPFCSLTHFAPHYYANGYSKYWYERVLDRNNFLIKEIEFNGNYFEYLAQEIRRIPGIEQKYTKLNVANKFLYKKSMQKTLELLNVLSSASTNSEELLCFGLCVLAEKK